MKTFHAFACSLAVLTFSAISQAAPVQYRITAETLGREIQFINDTQFQVIDDNTLFGAGTKLSATLVYDAEIPVTSIIPGDELNHGPAKYSIGSVTNFSAQVAGYTFSSDSADTFTYEWVRIFDADGNSLFTTPAIVTVAGSANAYPLSISQTNFQGFSVGNYTLIGYMIRPHNNDQPIAGILDVHNLQLIFANPDGMRRLVMFYAAEVTAVPLPGGLWLFASGLVGLGVNALRNFKR